MNQQPQHPISHPVVVVGDPDDTAQWKASRAFGAFAAAGLLVALWLPWFKVSAYLISAPDQQLTAKGGFAPINVSAWEVSTPLCLAIAASAFIALFIAARGPLGPDGRWLDSALGAYWLAAAIVFFAVGAIAFGIVPLPDSILSRCAEVTPALGAPAVASSNACAAGLADLRTQLMFGAGISVALSVLLLGSALWGTLKQPLGDYAD